MKRFSLTLFALFFLLLTGGIGYAQGTPPTTQINAALADLSTRAGTTVTLDDLAYWHWSQSNYPDTSLNCPKAGQTYSQVLTNGYEILFIYNGATFDYRASADGRIFFLCSGPATVPSVPAAQATAVPAQTSPMQTPVTGQSACAGAMATRLSVGQEARVRLTGLAVNVRSNPTSSSAKVGQMNPGDTFNITGGPQCAENLVWWQVAFGQITGWAGEGSNGLYWIEPTGNSAAVPGTNAAVQATPSVPPVPQTPQVYNATTGSLALVNTATAAQLVRFADLPIGEAVSGVAWSPDGQILAVTSFSGLNLYSAATFNTAPRLFQIPNGPTLALAFSADGSLLATAHNDTTVRVWDLAVGGLRAVLRGHTQPVQTLAFSPNGQLIASAGGNAVSGDDSPIRLWNVVSRLQVAALSGHTGMVTAVAFSPDGTLLASGSTDNTVRLWDVASASPGTVLPSHSQPVRAVAFSPDGKWLASAGDDGIIQLWQVGPGTQLSLESPSPVTALAFSPDGSVLAAAGQALNGRGDSAVRVWDVSGSKLIATLDTYGAPPDAVVTGLAFNKSGTLLAVSFNQGGSGLIRVFGIKP